MGRGILIAVVAVLVLSACGELQLASEDGTDLINANLRVTDFPEGSLIEKKPYLHNRPDGSHVVMELPNGVFVDSRVTRQHAPSEAAAEFQDRCAPPYDDWKVVEFVVNPGIRDVSRGERWTRERYSDLHVVCFSVKNLFGRALTLGAKDGMTAIKYARLLEKRILEELQNPTGPTPSSTMRDFSRSG